MVAGQISPGPQGLWGPIMSNASRSVGPHTVRQRKFSKLNVQIMKVFCLFRKQGPCLPFSLGPQTPLCCHGHHHAFISATDVFEKIKFC